MTSNNCYLLTGHVAELDEYEEVSEREETVWSQPLSSDLDIDFKVIVPTGYVFAIDRLNPSHILWQQKVR